MDGYNTFEELKLFGRIEEEYTHEMKRLKQDEKYVINQINMTKEKLKQQEELARKAKLHWQETLYNKYINKGKKTYYQYFPGAQKYLVRELKELDVNVKKEEEKILLLTRSLYNLQNNLQRDRKYMKQLRKWDEIHHKNTLCGKIGETCNIMYKDINVKLKF